MRKGLSPEAKKLLGHYFEIVVGKWRVGCPYFINVKKTRLLPVVYSGKGFPEEIEKEAKKIYLRRGRALSELMIINRSSDDAKDFLILAGLGVDCSGLVANVLDAHLKETAGRSIQRIVKQPGWYKKILSWVRPRTGFSADLLTGELNSNKVNLREVMPGDMIRQGKRHMMLIEWVESRNGRVVSLGYVESNTRPVWGVQRGEIWIVGESRLLEEQKWSMEAVKRRYARSSDKGIVRLRI